MAKKIKNPERYIKSLKKKIGLLKYESKLQQDKILQLKGDTVVVWIDGIEEIQGCSGRDLGQFRLNDAIVVAGKIIESREWFDNNGIPQSSIKFKRLYTKKVEAY